MVLSNSTSHRDNCPTTQLLRYLHRDDAKRTGSTRTPVSGSQDMCPPNPKLRIFGLGAHTWQTYHHKMTSCRSGIAGLCCYWATWAGDSLGSFIYGVQVSIYR